jgi:TP901-1 family phage major tail protein
MTAQKSRDMLLRLGDGATPETFTAVVGLRSRSFSLNARPIDLTDADSPGRWRELAGGVKSLAVSGAGVFRNAGADAAVREAFLTQSANRWQLVLPGMGVFTGPFLVLGLTYSGQHEGEAAYALSLASAGQISFGAAP